LAKKYKEQIEPIDRIRFDYSFDEKKFYWIITQKLINEKRGINNINELLIDASNYKIMRIEKKTLAVDF